MINIHSHMILTKVKIPGPAWDQQMAWVRGYILALEDVLEDLEALYRSMQYGYDAGPAALGAAEEKVTETLTQARATLATMEKMEDEHLEAVQREPGAGGPGRAPEASDPEDQGRVPDPGAV